MASERVVHIRKSTGLALVFATAAFAFVKGTAAFAPSAFDWTGWGLQVIEAVLPLITLAAVHVAREFWDRFIPPTLTPLLSMAISTLAGYVLSTMQAGAFHPIVAGLLGAVAAVLYAIADRVVQNRTNRSQ